MSAGDAITCAQALVRGLLEHGCAGFVVAPGSRSTPLVLAVAASGAPSWIVLDERSAGFFALGRARASGAPVAVVTTSGTATANLLPAMVEASYARVPLIAITADRPPELHGVGANQAIEQRGLYAAFVRASFDLDTASARSADAWSWAAARASQVAIGGPAGPVQINAPFREPFTPNEPLTREPRAPEPRAPERLVEPGVDATGDLDRLRDLLAHAQRPLVYAGMLDEPSPTATSSAVPVIAEPSLRFGASTANLQIQRVRDRLRPDLVIQLGRAPTSRAAQAFVADAGRLITVDHDGWVHDPSGRAETVLTASAQDVLDLLPEARVADGWAELWNRLDERVAEAIEASTSTDELWEGSVARILAAAPLDALFVGNSMPIRDLDRFAARPIHPRVFANRGASGIDGLVSTFAGISTASPRVAGLIGDLSLLHDAAGLLWLAREHAGTLVVVDNDGGGIFDHLGSAALPEHERWFVTPHGGRLAPLLRALEVPVVTATEPTTLEAALEATSDAAPMRVVHVPVSRTRALELRGAVHTACERAAAAALD